MDEEPRYLVFADGHAARNFARAGTVGLQARIVTALSRFRSLLLTNGGESPPDAAALLLPDLTSSCAREITRLVAEERRLPAVLGSYLTHENAAELNRLPRFRSVIFLRREPEQLREALNEAVRARVLFEVAAMIEDMQHLSPVFRATLAKACRLPKPVREVDHLAWRVMGYAPSTLRLHWHKEAAPGTTPHDFIDWLLVAHAVAAGDARRPLRSVAKELHVGREVLRGAISRRLGKVELTDLVTEPEGRLVDSLRRLLERRTSS